MSGENRGGSGGGLEGTSLQLILPVIYSLFPAFSDPLSVKVQNERREEELNSCRYAESEA